VLLRPNGNQHEHLQCFVKPTEQPTLSTFCTKLTGITQEVVDSAQTIEDTLKKVHDWLVEKKLLFCEYEEALTTTNHDIQFLFATDGKWDFKKFLIPELQRKHIRIPYYYTHVLDVRKAQALFYGQKQASLAKALNQLDMQFEGNEHCGLDDSRNITRILAKMIRDGFTPKANLYIRFFPYQLSRRDTLPMKQNKMTHVVPFVVVRLRDYGYLPETLRPYANTIVRIAAKYNHSFFSCKVALPMKDHSTAFHRFLTSGKTIKDALTRFSKFLKKHQRGIDPFFTNIRYPNLFSKIPCSAPPLKTIIENPKSKEAFYQEINSSFSNHAIVTFDDTLIHDLMETLVLHRATAFFPLLLLTHHYSFSTSQPISLTSLMWSEKCYCHFSTPLKSTPTFKERNKALLSYTNASLKNLETLAFKKNDIINK